MVKIDVVNNNFKNIFLKVKFEIKNDNLIFFIISCKNTISIYLNDTNIKIY